MYVTFRRREMNDVPILLEHVHLLNRLDRLHVEFLERGLQLLVVCAARLVHLFHFAAGCAFASIFFNTMGVRLSDVCVLSPRGRTVNGF